MKETNQFDMAKRWNSNVVCKQARFRYLYGLVLGLCVLCLYMAWFPGVYTLDEADILWQGRTGIYHDWHSPLLVRVWAMLGHFHSGPALPYLLYLGATVILCGRILSRTCPSPLIAGMALMAFAFYPPTFVMLGLVTKDLAFVATMLLLVHSAAQVLSAERRTIASVLWVVGASYLSLLVRPDGILAVAPIIFFIYLKWWAEKTNAKTILALRSALLTMVTGIALIASSVATNRLVFRARPYYAVQPVMLFDLAGISVQEDRLLLPADRLKGDNFSLAVVRARYTPGQADGLIWSSDGRRLDYRPDADQKGLFQAWSSAVRTFPASYLRHRLAYTANFLGIRNATPTLLGIYQADQSLPATRPAEEGWRLVNSPIVSLYRRVSESPFIRWLFYPWVFLIVASLVAGISIQQLLASGRSKYSKYISLLMSTSVMTYTLGFCLVSSGSVWRYHAWLKLGTTISILINLAPALEWLRRRFCDKGSWSTKRTGERHGSHRDFS